MVVQTVYPKHNTYHAVVTKYTKLIVRLTPNISFRLSLNILGLVVNDAATACEA